MSKKRLDLELVARGMAASRERAQALILSGNVLVNDVPVTKSGSSVKESDQIRLRSPDHPYVSRGALKLVHALKIFRIDVSGKVALDVGASTGGFTEVLLEQGASRVFALDVGTNQLHWKLRSDPRVQSMEKFHVKELPEKPLPQKVDIIVVDVAFISLLNVIPHTINSATSECQWVTLVKPQFEVGREHIGPGGIVSDQQAVADMLANIDEKFKNLGFSKEGFTESPILGGDGNREYLAHWRRK